VKVSEGCDHQCAFCIIPQLRGPHRSRPIESIIKETTTLAEQGVKEINLIAQDLTAYGRERRDGTTLYGLLREMVLVPGIHWIRLLYAYPNYLEEPLLHLIHDNEKICKYIDIPFQHINSRILRSMRRGKSGSNVREAIHNIRRAIPSITLRTSLIVGFPGETEEEFQELLDFVAEAQFDRLGVFKYSPEEGTRAALIGGQLPEEDKERRWQEVMEVQAEISLNKNRALIGTIQQVMIDGSDFSETEMSIGRTQAYAPEVDGGVYLNKGRETVKPGDLVNVRINQALDYDLIGDILNA
jgi:ribosomal protein S12 methylthiotransferase